MTRLALLRRSFPTPGLIVRWIGKSRRRIWCQVMVLVAIVAGPPLWWATQLVRLPDVGDPFDVAAFRASTIPDERNAFVLYRRAATLIKPNAGFPKTWTTRVDMLARWPKAVPELRQWAEENREALAVYRQGTERPDAFEMTIGFDRESFKTFQALRYSAR